MSGKRYPEEFKIEAVRLVTDRGYSLADVAGRLDVTTHSLYAWLKQYGPNANKHRAKAEDKLKLTGLIKQFWLESGAVYGYRKIYSDLRDYGERCGINRVYRLMRLSGIKAQVDYRRLRQPGGEAHVVTPNKLQRQFNVELPNTAW